MDPSSALLDAAESRKYYLSVLDATPDEMLTWHPKSASGDPTSILDITKHCIAGEAMFHRIIRDGGIPACNGSDVDWLSSEAFSKSGPAAEVTDKATLVATTEQLDADLRGIAAACPADAWEQTIETPFMAAPRLAYIKVLCTHWSYHCGQAAYIQRLYGDLSLG